MRNRYFLMRHGESLANLENLIISDPRVGCSGFGLSPLGRLQASRSAQQCPLGPEILVVASDFQRARETADIAASQWGCPAVTTDPRLRERFFGDWEGMSADHYHQAWERDEADPDGTEHGVESPRHLVERLSGLVEELEKVHQDRTLVLVSHGDPLRFLQLWAAGRDLRQHRQLKFFEPAEIRALA